MGKTINTRIQLKSDTELNWRKSVLSIDNEMGTKENVEGARSFVPQKGEAIIFEPDNEHSFSRLKIGDGITNVLSLPFIDAGTTNGYIVRKEVPSNAEFTDTTYSSGSGISIDNNNNINHTNSITPSSNSEKKVYKITYDSEGHITNAEEINVGTVKSVQIQASSPLQSSVSTPQTETLNTTISFTAQSKNTVFAGPTESNTDTPSFRSLTADDIPNLSTSKITGSFSAEQIGNLPASKITSGVLNEDRIPNLGPGKISGVIPISKGGTGFDGINGDPEHNILGFYDNGIFAYDAINTRFKQFRITTPGNTDTFTDYVNSLNGATGNLIVDLNTLIKAVPPINLNNPRDITENYINSYYAPKTKGWKNSVLISQGEENFNKGTEPIWLNPTALSAEGFHGGALFYGRYSREVERIVNDETVTSTETGFETQWGTLPVEQGGTGITNFNNDYVLIGSGENPIRTIQKTSSLISNTIVERDTNGDFATRSITLSQNLLCNNVNENFKDNKIISIDSSNKLATFFGNVNANNLTAFIGELKMSKTNSETIDQPSIKWYKGNSIKTESAITSQTNTLIGELYWDHNNSNRGMLRNYYLVNNTETYSDSYYLPETDASSTNNNIFTLLATEDSISNMFPSNSILYSNGKVNKITYKNSADGALYSTSTNGNLEWGTLPVAQGGTGLTTSGTVNAVIIGNSIESYKTRAFQTVSTNNGAFYATGVNSKPEFGTLPIGQGGTGVTSIADIQAGKDGDGNTISSTYLKLSGGTMTGTLTINSDIIQTSGNLKGQSDDNYTNHALKLGHSNDNVMQFFEYGGQFDFYQSQDGTNTLLFQVKNGISSKPLPINNGGTEATTAAAARANLEITPANIGARPDTEPASGNWFRGTPIVGNDGVMEIGKYIDFHASNATTADYDVRITANTTGLTLSGTTTGTFSGPLTGNVTGNCTGAFLLPSTSNDDTAMPDSIGPAFKVYKLTGVSNTIGNDGNLISMSWNETSNFGSQIFVDCDPTYNISLRQRNNTGVWQAWKRIPMGDGTGASGTWGISITGNAATATKATQDGSGNTITSTYLKLSGGTMTGTINFTATGTTGTSSGLYWSGSTDSATIDYYVPSSDLGYLRLNMQDDANARISFQNRSSEKAYVDGNGFRPISVGYSWLDGLKTGPINMTDINNTGAYFPWIRMTNAGSSKWFSLGVLNASLYIIGSTTSRTENGYDYGWRFDMSNGWAYGNFSNSDTVDGYHAANLWRSDGGTWNGNANISCTPTAANQEYSFDLGNAYTGTYWQVWSNKNSATILACYNDDRRVVAPVRFDTAWLRVVNNSSQNSDGAMVYLENKSNSDWALKINCDGYNYGINIVTSDNAGNALQTQGRITCKSLFANQGTNGERQIGVDSGTTGNLYMWANTTDKGIYSGSGYMTGHVIRITSTSRTFYGDCTGNAATATKFGANSNCLLSTGTPSDDQILVIGFDAIKNSGSVISNGDRLCFIAYDGTGSGSRKCKIWNVTKQKTVWQLA